MELLFEEAVANAVWITPIVSIIVQLLKPFSIPKDFFPHVSLGVGLLVGVVIGFASGNWIHLLTGLISGLAASGLYDTLKMTKDKTEGQSK